MNSKFLSYGALLLLHTNFLGALVKEISSVEEYKKVRNCDQPTIIVFNSPSCDACTKMEPYIKAASENPEYQEASFYSVNPQESLKELIALEDIKAFPTTLFIKKGKEPRRERGGMSEKEVQDITYQFLYDKRRPQPPVKKEVKTKKGA